jgi:hypothetical protein
MLSAILVVRGLLDYKETLRAIFPSGYPAIGLSYAKALSSDQVAFGLSDIILPMEVLYYAKRNIQEVSSEAQAISWLKHFNGSSLLARIDFQR